jgi:hypothetical protein
MRPPQSLARYAGADTKASADDAALVKMGTLKAWAAKIIQLIPSASRGITARRGLDGDVWTVGESAYGRWNPSFISSTEISVEVGSISDGVTTYTPDGSSVTVDASALNYVYLECDLTRSLVDGYVAGGTIDDVVIAAYTTAKTTTNSKGYVLLFTWQAGAVVTRAAHWSMQAELLNSGTGDVVFRTWVSA